MSIATYSDLQTAVGNWLNRSDLTANIPDFIMLAEKRIARRLRRDTVVATVTLNGQSQALPGDCGELRAIRLNNQTSYAPIQIVTPTALGDYAIRHNGVAGTPVAAAVVNNVLYLQPATDQAYDVELVYYQKLVPLSGTNPANQTLLDAPDLYLFGSLLEATPFLEHDERIQIWDAKFEAALNELIIERQRREYGASLRPMRLPVIMG